mgnify:FL=1
MEIIKSVYETDTEILSGISVLYLNGQSFELDPTYSKGVFYKTFKEPKYKSDLLPQVEGVVQSDCRKLWLNDNSINSICFDPPFLFRNRPSVNNDVNCKRFSYFKTFEELLLMYEESLIEFYRVLNKKGILAFKCQDMTDDKTYFTHCEVLKLAENNGFKVRDLFILVANNRIYHSETKQRHARKFHSYWYVIQKP